MKILGFLIGVGMIFGIVSFFGWMFVSMWKGNFGGLPWLGGFSGSYTIKGKITFVDKDEVTAIPTNPDTYDPMKQPLRVAPHPKPRKPKKPKPEWWRFLTEESIGSLLEKRSQRKAAKARKSDPWQRMR